jgi:hypothetical protein
MVDGGSSGSERRYSWSNGKTPFHDIDSRILLLLLFLDSRRVDFRNSEIKLISGDLGSERECNGRQDVQIDAVAFI